jgi:hypothetical protein
MKQFISQHCPAILGVLSGFDRVVFRGTLMSLVRDGGMLGFLLAAGVRLLDFKQYVVDVSTRLKAASLAGAEQQQRPVHYLPSSRINKEALARRLLVEHPIDEGLICALTSVEPCMSFEYHRSQDAAQRGLKLRPRKCLHIYHYYKHPIFGFCNVRIQTWFPFNIQICINGREWLARQLTEQGAKFRRDDNCIFWADDIPAAQRLFDEQLRLDWPGALDELARRVNPIHDEIFQARPDDYYWSLYQSEWATDVLFTSPATLADVYPRLTRHAMVHFQSPDVMRFLGRKANGNFLGEIVSSFKDRPEGVRLKHWLKGNSIKMYDKAGSVLRVETTIAKPDEFKVFRPSSTAPDGPDAWRPMRKGVADLHRRAEVSQQANSRYLDALAVADDSTPLHEVLDAVSKHTRHRKQRVRALRIGDPSDIALLAAVARGEFATSGFRNRDLREVLYPSKQDELAPAETRRLSTKVGRQIRMLRAHGLIRKLPKSHRYRLTKKGALLTAALTAVRGASIKQLLDLAA